jgi:MoaD family protein
MPKITVKYFGILHELVGKRSEELNVPGNSSLVGLIDSLVETHGRKFKNFLYDSSGKPRKGLAFAVNGDTIPESKLRRMKLEHVREFVILPPISGG